MTEVDKKTVDSNKQQTEKKTNQAHGQIIGNQKKNQDESSKRQTKKKQ